MGSSQSSHVKSKAASKKKQQPKELKDVRGRESKEVKPTISFEENVANKEEAAVVEEQQQGLVATDESSEYDEDTDDDHEEDEEYDEFLAERLCVLQDAKKLKQLAVMFSHPEEPVKTTDPCAYGRNFFSRPSAPEQESLEEAEERARILQDAQLLKKYAVDYAHPELPVVTTDPTACGRNYFDRASAPEQESLEDMEARELVLADMRALKKLAVDYLHPELPVTTTDSYATGRNYFDRPSAPEQETFEEAEERARILVDAMH
jgi:hypothetical protein